MHFPHFEKGLGKCPFLQFGMHALLYACTIVKFGMHALLCACTFLKLCALTPLAGGVGGNTAKYAKYKRDPLL